MYRTVIIEDQREVREAFVLLIERACPGILSIIGFAEDVDEAVLLIDKEKPEVVFMDIELKKGTAFDVLNAVDYKDFYLVFTTAYEEHAIKAFKYSAIDYLLKPIDMDDLQQTIEKINFLSGKDQRKEQLSVLQDNINSTIENPAQQKLVLSTHNGMYIFPLSKIIRVEAVSSYSTFFISNNMHNKITVSKSLGDYDELLSPFNFVRVHQSHIINIEYLSEITRDDMALLSDNSRVPIAHRRKDEFVSLVKKMGIHRAK